MDIILEGRILYRGDLTPACIGIKDGRISRISKTMGTQNLISMGNSIIMPGGVDLHVHMREPGMAHKETFKTGSTAAARGGTTFFLDMPNTTPPTSDLSSLEEKMSLARASVVDYGLHALASGRASKQLGEAATGWKWYYGPSTNTTSWTDLDAAKKLFLSTPGFTTVHAEEPKLIGKPGKNLEGHHAARPPESETVALDNMARVGIFGLHAAHCSTTMALASARKAGYTMEVTPHHLLLDISKDLGTWGKVNPPLRTSEARQALMAMLQKEDVVVASDHAPHTIDEKEKDFQEAPSGMPGVEERFPLMMALAKRGVLDIGKVGRSCCETPAMLLGLSKGRIAEGYDADLVVFDPRDLQVINKPGMTKCGWTPYAGLEAIFPSFVFLRGEALVERGDLTGSHLRGRYVGHAKPPEAEVV